MKGDWNDLKHDIVRAEGLVKVSHLGGHPNIVDFAGSLLDSIMQHGQVNFLADIARFFNVFQVYGYAHISNILTFLLAIQLFAGV